MRSYPLYLTDPAQEDIYRSEAFYADQDPLLGEYFYDSIIADLDALRLYAGIHMKVFGFHRMLTRKFPYAIYYKIEDDCVVVHAVLNTRQDPTRIKERFETPSS